MSRRFFVVLSSLLMAVVLTLTALPSGALAARKPSAETTYQSPTYDYTLSWDTSWEVQEEWSEDGHDYLQLSNGVSSVFVEGFRTRARDHETCLVDAADTLSAESGVEEMTLAETTDGEPMIGGDASGAWGIFEISYVSEDGDLLDFIALIHCRVMVPGRSAVQFTQISLSEDFSDQADSVLNLLDGLTVPRRRA